MPALVVPNGKPTARQRAFRVQDLPVAQEISVAAAEALEQDGGPITGLEIALEVDLVSEDLDQGKREGCRDAGCRHGRKEAAIDCSLRPDEEATARRWMTRRRVSFPTAPAAGEGPAASVGASAARGTVGRHRAREARTASMWQCRNFGW